MKMELLSPAGDIESFKQAIDKGADAVYFGLQNFNARRNADNFNEENVDKWVRYAHLFGVKAYVTLNTNVKDSEQDELIRIIKACDKAKVDAFIVTDMMTACLIRKYTNVPMHASTQMGVTNFYGAKYLEKLGFTRVVLARETLEKDIVDIKRNTNLEIEYFVHGALCVCYSGQCLFSSIISGESGNRGLCKQPCRQLYKSENSNGYLLSTKDLCLIDKIDKLSKLGIDSLKIEGRLKRPEYVGVVTKNYRDAIDEFYQKNCSLKNTADFSSFENNQENNTIRDNESNFSNNSFVTDDNYINNKSKYNVDEKIAELKKIYNRGNYTKGYLFNDDVTYKKVQNHLGKKVGEIVKIIGKNSVLKAESFNENNGYKVFRKGEELSGGKFKLVKNLGKGEFLIDYFGRVGDEFNITTDAMQIENISQYTRKIKTNIEIEIKTDDYVSVKLSTLRDSIIIKSNDKISKAENKPITACDVVKIFNKVGETVFTVNVMVDIDENVFYPLSKLNNLRKEAYRKLEDRIIENYESNILNKERENTNIIKQNILEYFNLQNISNIEQCILKNTKNNNNDKIGKNGKRFVAVEIDTPTISEKLLSRIDVLVVNPFYKNDDSIIKYYYDLIRKNSFSCKLYLKLPTIARGSDIVVIENLLHKYSNILDGLYFNTIYGFELCEKYNLDAFGGIGQNLYNQIAINNKYYTYLTLSTELNKEEILSLNCNKAFVYAFGKLPLMTMAHCVNKNINGVNCTNCNAFSDVTDTKIKDIKYSFDIRRNKISSCYFTLYNSFTTNILDYCIKYNMNIYLDMVQYTGNVNSTLETLLNGKYPNETYTKGHLNRGVK